MRLGFTGSRRGMSRKQQLRFEQWLPGRHIEEFRHGAARGADTTAAHIMNMNKCRHIIAYPCNLADQVSDEAIKLSTDLVSPQPPLVRNHQIVDNSDVIIACPDSEKEVMRSGTWATVRYARNTGKRTIVIYPSGAMETWNREASHAK